MELARRLGDVGKWNEAYRVLVNVVKIDSRFETVFQLALAEYNLERFDDALSHFQEAQMIAGEERPEFFELFKTLGNIYVRKGDFESAEDNYNKAHRLNENSGVLWVNFGTLMVQKANWSEAVAKFRKALELDIKNDKAWVGLAMGHRMMGDWELAWANLEAALENNPLNEVALNLALNWGSYEGREFRVLEMIRGFLVKGGWNEKLSLAFAWLSWRRGDRNTARLELERVVAVNPHNIRALEMITEMQVSL
jgi:tetratricopeptide (TPR) repeat protein